MRKKLLALACLMLSAVLALAGCGANTSNSGGGSDSGSGGADLTKGTIGVVLPETATSARWEGFDKPMLKKALNKRGYKADIQNAQGEVDKFVTLAEGMIAKGVDALIVAAINSKVGNTVVTKAKQAGIPVVEYDRLITGGASENYYVSFDNVRVGQLQGKALKEALAGKQGAQVIEIQGAPTDNNAHLFKKGQRKVLQPLYDSGKLELVDSQMIKNWDNQKGGDVFEQMLTANGGSIDGVVAANDGLAGAVITVLKKYGLASQVPVTGQDATPAGLRAVLRGTQYMTVFKEIKKEAEAAAKLAAALAEGDKAKADEIASDVTVDPKSGKKVPSVLLQPKTITKENVKLVVDKGYVQASQICAGDLKATCAKLGIS